ncbi:MAG: threonine-phosphate decarboxylase CobD [Rhodomicrobiaceae bacterium]
MKHGGDLADASRLNTIPNEDWLDLSTGINPHTYPFRAPSIAALGKLPQSQALGELLTAARRAYGATGDAPIVAAPGTQILIQLLPLIRPASRVAIVGPTYSEHTTCWERTGAAVTPIEDLAASPGDSEVVVLVNPNNPTGRIAPPELVQTCAAEMAARGGLLIVDEAFADVAPEISVAPLAGADGLLVLRSFGKFFGLAGLRLGFALGSQAVLEQLEAILGPWAVSGPAMEIGRDALDDVAWQQGARARCYQRSAMLDDVLAAAGGQILGGTALFRLVAHKDAASLHEQLAARGIWVRRFDDKPGWLRFGLPPDDFSFDRLAAALREISA